MKKVWRFQCDPGDAVDPGVTVFMGEEYTDEAGEVKIYQETRFSFTLPLSQLAILLKDQTVLETKRSEEIEKAQDAKTVSTENLAKASK